MKKLLWLTIALTLPAVIQAADMSPLRANPEDQPLRIAVTSYTAPFVMQGSYNQFYGFDISMVEYVCHAMQRTCQYVPMNLNQIYSAIVNQQVDLAISSIVITPERSKYVQFSIPYMISEGQFIGSNTYVKQQFDVAFLGNKKIGVVQGSAYATQLGLMGITNPRIVNFDSTDQIVAAIKSGDIDLGFFDTHTVAYWQNNSSGSLHALGNIFSVGFGLGIVVNNNDVGLLQKINLALFQYQDSPDFKTNYRLYLESF